jgi:hypothetical protein
LKTGEETGLDDAKGTHSRRRSYILYPEKRDQPYTEKRLMPLESMMGYDECERFVMPE